MTAPVQFAVCIVLLVMQRICGDENGVSVVLSREDKKKKCKSIKEYIHLTAKSAATQPHTTPNKAIWWHSGTITFLIHVGVFRSEETAALSPKNFDIEKSERSQIPLCSTCSLWALITIQHPHCLPMSLSTPVDRYTASQTHFAMREIKINPIGWKQTLSHKTFLDSCQRFCAWICMFKFHWKGEFLFSSQSKKISPGHKFSEWLTIALLTDNY